MKKFDVNIVNNNIDLSVWVDVFARSEQSAINKVKKSMKFTATENSFIDPRYNE